MSKFKEIYSKNKTNLYNDLLISKITFSQYGKTKLIKLIFVGLILLILFPFYLPFGLMGAICNSIHKLYSKLYNGVRTELNKLNSNYDALENGKNN